MAQNEHALASGHQVQTAKTYKGLGLGTWRRFESSCHTGKTVLSPIGKCLAWGRVPGDGGEEGDWVHPVLEGRGQLQGGEEEARPGPSRGGRVPDFPQAWPGV